MIHLAAFEQPPTNAAKHPGGVIQGAPNGTIQTEQLSILRGMFETMCRVAELGQDTERYELVDFADSMGPHIDMLTAQWGFTIEEVSGIA